jgi:hypothetical protein
MLAAALPVRGEQAPPRGLFIGTRVNRVQLTAFATPIDGQRLQMAGGTLDDIPVISPSTGLRVFSAMPNWRPTAIVVGNAAVFGQGRVITRPVPFIARTIAPFALELRVTGLEDPGALARLVASVNGSGDEVAYLFVVMSSNGSTRHFPVRLKL